ncbi:hypothetical protein SHELI_v1c02680 [Spiroplasma helicoides]|uniref:DegV family protein n=1 Tax=Spiroplasma helicoides TaxID=216938 RepID=A0A1B3SJW1_9MOLU|nr:DegV family protein [Spiroplasma helicoides]AOG60223.1 hypothetical protein SHELI_v1c02680 [Spiroplasma helicoides]
MSKVAIIIDSASGVKDLSKYKDTYLVPLLIVKENGSSIDDDENFGAEQFEPLFEEQILKTSQCITGVMLEKWDNLLKEYDHIICLLISKGLSGQYSTFKVISQSDEYGYKGRVHVVDTNGVSMILERQVMLAQKLLGMGKTVEETCQIIEDKYANIKGYIIPRKLDQLVRGGRISKAAAKMAKMLKITPILSYTGEIDKEGKTRTFKKAVATALDKVLTHLPKNYVLDVTYSKCDSELLNDVIKLIEERNIKIGLAVPMPYTIVCHTGYETFGFLPDEVYEED